MRDKMMIKSHFCDGEGKRPRCDPSGLRGLAAASSVVEFTDGRHVLQQVKVEET